MATMTTISATRSRAKPTAPEHPRAGLVFVRIVGEELGNRVAELMVRLLDGLQAELERPLFRGAAREGADLARAVVSHRARLSSFERCSPLGELGLARSRVSTGISGR